MTKQELAALLVCTNMQEKMRKAMYLHFVKGLGLAEAARQADVKRPNAHMAAKRVRELHAEHSPASAAPPEQTPLDPQPQQPAAQPEPSREQTPFGEAYGAWSIARLMLVMKYDEGTPEYDVQAATVADLQERLYRVATVADWERMGECPSDWTPYQPPEQTPLERATNKLAYLKQMEPAVLADRDECRVDLATLTPGSPEYSTTLDYIATAEEQLVAIRQQIHAAIDRVQDLTVNIHT